MPRMLVLEAVHITDAVRYIDRGARWWVCAHVRAMATGSQSDKILHFIKLNAPTYFSVEEEI